MPSRFAQRMGERPHVEAGEQVRLTVTVSAVEAVTSARLTRTGTGVRSTG